ncbi:S8 family serine peptidase [Streptomyces sp. NPDC127197]|uniref:S8 family serine peptidase n=1 Tax=Streptomyces sp. NPDC127197 TaxID=3345388 RepID=UPI00362BA366
MTGTGSGTGLVRAILAPRASRRARRARPGGPVLGVASAAAALALLVPQTASAAGGTAARATEVKLPVMPAVLDDDAPCTGGSSRTVRAEPGYQRSLDLEQAWRFSRGGGVEVAVVDTGVATGTARLEGRVTRVSGDGDCVGHGSFLAGLVAAAPVSGTEFSGVAPEAHVFAVRGTDQRGRATASSLAAGIRDAADAGARVILVGPALPTKSSALTRAVEHAADKDALVVASAAPQIESGEEPAPPRDYWPAAQHGVLSVLGTAPDGSLADGTALPEDADLSAPGAGVIGVGPRGKGHFISSGSALAAAFVAGAAALVRDLYPDLSAAAAADRLTRSAYPATVPRLDLYAALSSSVSGPEAVPEPTPRPVRLSYTEPTEAAVRRGTLMAGVGAATAGVVAWSTLAVHARRRRGEEDGG